tara:strand:+ start:48344 stop:48922 length:579 start_codon:yes stop_codon:yes gene_type:complete
MVKKLLLVLSLAITGCASNPQEVTKTPSIQKELFDIELLSHEPVKPIPYPEDLEQRIKAATVVRKTYDQNFELYQEVHVGTEETNTNYLPIADRNDELFILVDTETVFKIRDAVVAARDNGKLVEKLDKVQELNIEERNQILRMLRLEYMHSKRMEEFNEYYKDEIKRQETSNRIDSLTWRIIAVLSLAVAI